MAAHCEPSTSDMVQEAPGLSISQFQEKLAVECFSDIINLSHWQVVKTSYRVRFKAPKLEISLVCCEQSSLESESRSGFMLSVLHRFIFEVLYDPISNLSLNTRP